MKILKCLSIFFLRGGGLYKILLIVNGQHFHIKHFKEDLIGNLLTTQSPCMALHITGYSPKETLK